MPHLPVDCIVCGTCTADILGKPVGLSAPIDGDDVWGDVVRRHLDAEEVAPPAVFVSQRWLPSPSEHVKTLPWKTL